MSAEASAHLRAERARTRGIVTVSCWHEATLETEGMWVRYGGSNECVAIRSTMGRLSASFGERQNPRQKHLHSIYLGKVDYIDFTNDTFPPYNTFYPFVHKRREFRHEQEVRAVAMISEAAAAAGATPDFEVTEMGLLLPVDVATLIDAVVVSPMAIPAFERDVKTTLDGLEFGSTSVVKSTMAGAPIY